MQDPKANMKDKPTGFLHLPREIRDEIYFLAGAAPDGPHELCCKGHRSYYQDCTFRSNIDFSQTSALLLVSHQINTEIWDTFFANAHLFIRLPNYPVMRQPTHESWIFSIFHRRCPCPNIIARATKMRLHYGGWPWSTTDPSDPWKMFVLEVSVKQERGVWTCEIEDLSYESDAAVVCKFMKEEVLRETAGWIATVLSRQRGEKALAFEGIELIRMIMEAMPKPYDSSCEGEFAVLRFW